MRPCWPVAPVTSSDSCSPRRHRRSVLRRKISRRASAIRPASIALSPRAPDGTPGRFWDVPDRHLKPAWRIRPEGVTCACIFPSRVAAATPIFCIGTIAYDRTVCADVQAYRSFFAPAINATRRRHRQKKEAALSGQPRAGRSFDYFAALSASTATAMKSLMEIDTPEMASVLPSALTAILAGSCCLTRAASTRADCTFHSPSLAFIL